MIEQEFHTKLNEKLLENGSQIIGNINVGDRCGETKYFDDMFEMLDTATLMLVTSSVGTINIGARR